MRAKGLPLHWIAQQFWNFQGRDTRRTWHSELVTKVKRMRNIFEILLGAPWISSLRTFRCLLAPPLLKPLLPRVVMQCSQCSVTNFLYKHKFAKIQAGYERIFCKNTRRYMGVLQKLVTKEQMLTLNCGTNTGRYKFYEGQCQDNFMAEPSLIEGTWLQMPALLFDIGRKPLSTHMWLLGSFN